MPIRFVRAYRKILLRQLRAARLEYRVYDNWLLRGEYRYANFGTWTGDILNLTEPATIPALVGHSLKVSTQIATGRITYKFGP